MPTARPPGRRPLRASRRASVVATWHLRLLDRTAALLVNLWRWLLGPRP